MLQSHCGSPDPFLHQSPQHGVAVAPGDTFGRSGVGALRISLAAAESTIVEGLRRIAAVITA
ncbi:hypothetical protein [Euzebya tangerina]|uniref:hypothetical protein n=1 Tax=Euzebya tangerina TaxID=591198 RepID=UPI000E324720|nr:hypothetical protein [Euzebya tangerina]